eukprot:229206-Amphidinium_carterae.2
MDGSFVRVPLQQRLLRHVVQPNTVNQKFKRACAADNVSSSRLVAAASVVFDFVGFFNRGQPQGCL